MARSAEIKKPTLFDRVVRETETKFAGSRNVLVSSELPIGDMKIHAIHPARALACLCSLFQVAESEQ